MAAKLQNLDELFNEEEQRALQRARSAEGEREFAETMKRTHAKALREDIAAGRRNAAGEWIAPEPEDTTDEDDTDDQEEG